MPRVPQRARMWAAKGAAGAATAWGSHRTIAKRASSPTSQCDRLLLSYVVPLRSEKPDEALALDLKQIVTEVDDLIVVDGSDAPVYERHSELLPPAVRHLPPEHVTA